jgi:hypothetical protein
MNEWSLSVLPPVMLSQRGNGQLYHYGGWNFWQGQDIIHSYATTTAVEPVDSSLLINRVVRSLFIC